VHDYFFFAAFFAGFFAAAFFAAMRTPPPFDVKMLISVCGIAEFVRRVKFSFLDFSGGTERELHFSKLSPARLSSL
jgi:hypothetical protein